jgi:cyclophilin family peptidyl-prolyl cis-trans isomerase
MQLVRLALLGIAVLALIAACWLTGCGGAAKIPAASVEVRTDSPAAATVSGTGPVASAAAEARLAAKRVDPVVVLRTSAGDVQVQLFQDKAPQTVDNFLRTYAQRNYYDGTIFHYVEPGSMVIAGGYTADLQPKPTRSPIFNESQNGLSNKRGTIAMIRDPANAHSATSQFFINLADNPAFDFHVPETAPIQETEESAVTDEAWGFCVFGEVIAGLDVLDRIAQSPVVAQGEFEKVPREAIVINSVEQIR